MWCGGLGCGRGGCCRGCCIQSLQHNRHHTIQVPHPGDVVDAIQQRVDCHQASLACPGWPSNEGKLHVCVCVLSTRSPLLPPSATQRVCVFYLSLAPLPESRHRERARLTKGSNLEKSASSSWACKKEVNCTNKAATRSVMSVAHTDTRGAALCFGVLVTMVAPACLIRACW